MVHPAQSLVIMYAHVPVPRQSCCLRQVSKIDPAAHEVDAKEELVEKINTYIQEKIVFADNVLVTNAVAKVYDDDVILTYSFSSVIFNILLRAKKVGNM